MFLNLSVRDVIDGHLELYSEIFDMSMDILCTYVYVNSLGAGPWERNMIFMHL